ncbi:hypothetical protein PHJA_001898500 [Phtheirospermum japonicum]|uniref:Uncharacterized protein n=1 Tax=Phtheirospermum japonicum TaxID=374723 RepID=A0A830CMT7_9LAMI|nr:hypothetical protein PHJA_001898500 [Phtheirospermum japonicum]
MVKRRSKATPSSPGLHRRRASHRHQAPTRTSHHHHCQSHVPVTRKTRPTSISPTPQLLLATKDKKLHREIVVNNRKRTPPLPSFRGEKTEDALSIQQCIQDRGIRHSQMQYEEFPTRQNWTNSIYPQSRLTKGTQCEESGSGTNG